MMNGLIFWLFLNSDDNIISVASSNSQLIFILGQHSKRKRKQKRKIRSIHFTTEFLINYVIQNQQVFRLLNRWTEKIANILIYLCLIIHPTVLRIILIIFQRVSKSLKNLFKYTVYASKTYILQSYLKNVTNLNCKSHRY